MDPLALKASVDELTGKTLPELLAILTAAMDRAEKLVDRLDGATVTLTLPKKEIKP